MPRLLQNKTDWKRVKQEGRVDAPISFSPEDGPYNPNDAEAAEAYLSKATVRSRGKRGPQKSPTKERITIRLSPEVLGYFKATGEGWQGRTNEALMEWVKQH